MPFRTIASTAMGCAILVAFSAARAADRGPSTPEERQQMLGLIHEWQANPVSEKSKEQFGQVLKFFTDVPDLTVHVCTILDKLPKGDKKDGATIFGGEFMGQAAFVLENPDKKDDELVEYQAGVEGALRVYELLVKANPKDREPYLDDLIQQREAGTLFQFTRGRATSCTK